MTNLYGENSSTTKIPELEVLKIKEMLKQGYSQAEIVRQLDFTTRSIVQEIANDSRWKYLNE